MSELDDATVARLEQALARASQKVRCYVVVDVPAPRRLKIDPRDQHL